MQDLCQQREEPRQSISARRPRSGTTERLFDEREQPHNTDEKDSRRPVSPPRTVTSCRKSPQDQVDYKMVIHGELLPTC